MSWVRSFQLRCRNGVTMTSLRSLHALVHLSIVDEIAVLALCKAPIYVSENSDQLHVR